MNSDTENMNNSTPSDANPDNEPATQDAGVTGKSRPAITLKLSRKDTPAASDTRLKQIILQKTDVAMPAISTPSAKEEELSITDLINSAIPAGTGVKQTDDAQDLEWNDDNFFDNKDQTTESRSFSEKTVEASHKMECIECGAIYESENPLESCTCPECHGTMYPLDLFNSEDTLSYLNHLEDNTNTISMSDSPQPQPSSQQSQTQQPEKMTDSKRAIKVAQPVSVGMFSSTGTGPVSGGTSSASMKAVDFLSSSGSASAIQLETRMLNPTEEELAAIEREKQNLLEERRRLQAEQNEFAAAVAEFENKSKMLEEMRLSMELEKEQQTAASVSQTANLMLVQEQLRQQQNWKSQRFIIAMGVIIIIETIFLIIILLKK